MKGCCLLPVIPVRETPSHTSQLVNQLLFGDLYEVTGETGDWLRIQGTFDQYEGYIRGNQHFEGIPEGSPVVLCEDQAIQVKFAGNSWKINLPAGSTFYGNGFSMAGMQFNKEGAAKDADFDTALGHFRFSPYMWGGRTRWGIDCSGFTQVVYKILGYQLPRDAWQQAALGETVDFPGEATRGDLAFFDNEEGKIAHVGIITQPGMIMHASGFVREDPLDHEGIFDPLKKRYTHKLRLIKKFGSDF